MDGSLVRPQHFQSIVPRDGTPRAKMAKIGKLGKLRSIIKRWNSSSQISHTGGCGSREGSGRSTDDETWQSAASFHGDEIPGGFHPVYVGKSRRRYLLSPDVVNHPIFRTLINRSGGGGGGGDGEAVVGCEVVLFEHLLWMLENADPQPELLDELVDFYAC